ncbi:mavicyanin-like [Mangifera indica]|uniref:mavicyanin-like n=1 Tax=Mangifera indica TaxID=29780 RepID=UPI001CFB3FC6|nr:mavicyanin-like [Mangifera indica]
MAFAKNVVALLLLTTIFGGSLGAVYKVGDSAGWTVVGNVDYNKWASTKNFHVGDVIVFSYNNQFHNVKQVTHKDFKSCNATSAMAVYTSGSDSITLNNTGHHYFMCGFPGHCEAGQKVDIMVTPVSLSPTTSPFNALPPSGSPLPAPTPTATINTASSLQSFKLLWALFPLAFLVIGFGY